MRVTQKTTERLVERAVTVPHSKVIERAEALGLFGYVGISKTGVILFRSRAAEPKKVPYWTQRLKIDGFGKEIPKLVGTRSRTIQEILMQALEENELEFRCSCPSFSYHGYKFINTKLGSVFGWREHRFPKVRNPKLEGILCKHLYAVLESILWKKMTIAEDIRRGKFISSIIAERTHKKIRY